MAEMLAFVVAGKTWCLLRPGIDLPDECETRCVMRDAKGRLVVSDNEDGGIYTLEKNGKWSYDDLGDDIMPPTVYVMASQQGVDYFGTHMGLWRRKKGGELE